MQEEKEDLTRYVTLDVVRDEINNYLKKMFRTEFCPNCNELQSMAIIYHLGEMKLGLMPKISESYRCLGCLHLYESKLEEVTERDNIHKVKMGFANTPNKEESSNNKIKPVKREEN
jgi:hypothetical protein